MGPGPAALSRPFIAPGSINWFTSTDPANARTTPPPPRVRPPTRARFEAVLKLAAGGVVERLMKLIIKVIGVKGHCPVYQVGNLITIKQGFILALEETDAICLHSLASLLPYYVALSHGVKARVLGLARGDSETAYLQCLDPCEFTGGGTVYFEISRLEESGAEPEPTGD
jgi:uncharacterized repeat protein (TIGR04076 family)